MRPHASTHVCRHARLHTYGYTYVHTYIYVRTYVRNVLSLVVGSALVVVAVIADEPLCHKKRWKKNARQKQIGKNAAI